MIHDPASGLVESAEPSRPEAHLPQPFVDFLAAHVELRQHVTHVHPATAPPNPPVTTHAAHFIMPRVGDRQEGGGVGPRRRLVETGRQALAERFVGAFGVVALPKPIKAALGEYTTRWSTEVPMTHFSAHVRLCTVALPAVVVACSVNRPISP